MSYDSRYHAERYTIDVVVAIAADGSVVSAPWVMDGTQTHARVTGAVDRSRVGVWVVTWRGVSWPSSSPVRGIDVCARSWDDVVEWAGARLRGHLAAEAMSQTLPRCRACRTREPTPLAGPWRAATAGELCADPSHAGPPRGRKPGPVSASRRAGVRVRLSRDECAIVDAARGDMSRADAIVAWARSATDLPQQESNHAPKRP